LDFDNTNLSRIDLSYDRKLKKSDEIENFDSFLEECCSQIEKADKRKIVIVDKSVLRVGKRESGNYFRVYRRPNGKDIRFELELKKSAIKKFQSYFF
jgi:DNA relaxase NicK